MLQRIFKQKSSRDLFYLFIAIVLGALVGVYFPHFISSIEWMGKIFMNYLMLLVLPLIFFALVSAITSLGDETKIGTLGKISFLTILANVGLASLIGLLFSLLFQPGHGVNHALFMQKNSILTAAENKTLTFSGFMEGIFPANLGAVAIHSEILPIVIFSVFFSIVAVQIIQNPMVKISIQACLGMKEIILQMISVVMKFTPLAMFALIGNAVSQSILSGHFAADMMGILKFMIIFLAGCVALCVLQYFVLALFLGSQTFVFFRNSLESSSTAFATSSSMAALPVMLLNAQELEIDDSISKFVLPLTVVFNLGSSALYVACATLFVAQGLGIHIGIWHLCVVYLTTVLTGLGTTGIPNAGFIATMTVLKTISVPPSAVAILFPMDAILSRVRSSVNVWGDLVCAKLIDLMQNRSQKKPT